jgi:hypothetical protein
MVGCSAAEINLRVKYGSGYRPPTAWSETSRVAAQDLGTWAKGCVAEAKSGRKAYEVVAVLHPMELGSTASDLIVRYLGTQSELQQRIGALQ